MKERTFGNVLKSLRRLGFVDKLGDGRGERYVLTSRGLTAIHCHGTATAGR
jgi:hypothetical protein